MPPTPGCTPPTPSFIPATPRRHGTKRPCGHHLPPPQRRDVATRPLVDPRWPLTTRPPSPRRCSTVDSASSPSLDPAATGRRSACRGMLPPRSGRLQSYRGRCRAARLALARPPWAAWPGSPASVWVPSGGAPEEGVHPDHHPRHSNLRHAAENGISTPMLLAPSYVHLSGQPDGPARPHRPEAAARPPEPAADASGAAGAEADGPLFAATGGLGAAASNKPRSPKHHASSLRVPTRAAAGARASPTHMAR